jgi:predicted SprT family Zn-dependent metalloprotease
MIAQNLEHHLSTTTMMTKEEASALRLRFESHLPKYGGMWRMMAAATKKKKPEVDFMSAIESKKPVSLTVQHHGNNNCPLDDCGGCAPPIYEEEHDDGSETFLEQSRPSSPVSYSGNTVVGSTSRYADFDSPVPSDEGNSLHIDMSRLHLGDDDGDHPFDRVAPVESRTSNGSATVLHTRSPAASTVQVSPGAESAASSESSGGSTVIRFDLSVLQDEVQEEVQSPAVGASSPALLERTNLGVNAEEEEQDATRPSAAAEDTVASPSSFAPRSEVVLETLSPQSSPAASSSSSESSGGSTVIRFDLSVLQDEVQEEVDTRTTNNDAADALFADMACLEINECPGDFIDDEAEEEGSFANLEDAATIEMNDEEKDIQLPSNADEDEDNEESDCSTDSSGNTVVRFDLSYLQPEVQDSEDDDEQQDLGLTPEPPVTPSLRNVVENDHETPPPADSQQSDVFHTPEEEPFLFKKPSDNHNDDFDLVDTPSPIHVPAARARQPSKDDAESTSSIVAEEAPVEKKGYETGDSWLAEDDEESDDEQSWAAPKKASNTVAIIISSETEWNATLDDEDGSVGSVENEQPWSSIIILSDSDCSDDDEIPPSYPRTPLRRKQQINAKPQPSAASFRKNRDALTTRAFDEFNELVFDRKLSSVDVIWSNTLRTTAGLTRLKRVTATRLKKASIELSTKVLDDEQRLRNTLLHEMCHAAQWLVDSVQQPPHGKCFKKWANRAMKNMPGIVVTTLHEYAIQYKFAWTCTTPKCGAIFQRQSNSIDISKQRCGKCKGILIEINAPRRDGVIDRTPKKKAPLSVYQLFVKEHSGQVRKRLESERQPGGRVLQPEVMKECGRLWKEKKNGSA